MLLTDNEPPRRWRRLWSRLLIALGAAVVLGGAWLILGGGPDLEQAARIRGVVADVTSAIRFESSQVAEGSSEAAEGPPEAARNAPGATEGPSPRPDEVASAATGAGPVGDRTSTASEGPPPSGDEPSSSPSADVSPRPDPAPTRRDVSATVGEPSPVRTAPSTAPREFDDLLQAAESSIVGYQQRQSDFDLTRIGCYELTAGYARLDADVMSLALWRSDFAGTLAPRQSSAYEEVMRRAAVADRLFDRTGCPRP